MNAVRTGLLILGLAAGTVVLAQEHHDHGTPEERAQRRTEKLAEELSLTDAQKEQLKTIHLNAIKQHEEIRSNEALTPEQRHEALETRRAADKAEIEALLTAEQKVVFEKKMAETKEKHDDFRSEHGRELKDATAEQRAAMKTQKMAEMLTLTDDQKTKIADLNLRIEQKRDAIRKDDAKSEEERKAAMKELHRSQKSELSKILTKEQLEKLKTEHGKHHKDGDCTKPD